MGLWIAVGITCGCLGCYRGVRTSYPAGTAHPVQSTRPTGPSVAVNPEAQGPIHYRWVSTNGPAGKKVFRFAPGQ